jgi:hypothetical protein
MRLKIVLALAGVGLFPQQANSQEFQNTRCAAHAQMTCQRVWSQEGYDSLRSCVFDMYSYCDKESEPIICVLTPAGFKHCVYG